MNQLPDLPCFLNGEYSSARYAKVSVLDRGFIFGDGVYEVIPVYGGVPFRVNHHLARLSRSLAELRIPNPHSPTEWTAIAHQLVIQFALQSGVALAHSKQLIYIQVTRGVAVRDHVMPEHITPTVFVMTNTMRLPTVTQRETGVRCVSAADFRWEKAHIKSTSLLGAVLSRQISADANALETVMFRNGFLSEAAASNVWVVNAGKLLGVPKDNLVLEGIRYGLMEELCAQQGIPFELRPISEAEVRAADELLLTSATKEVLPVRQLDANAVGDGRPGPIYHRLYAAYQQALADATGAASSVFPANIPATH
jgi:D-alanine transaminase